MVKNSPRLLKPRVKPERVLLTRVVVLVSLVAAIMTVFWLDRDGLKDNLDDHLSFSDIAYFTAVTVTTVGYGDIVPVTDRARIIDALVVTPLRLIIWLVFVGTAYELVLQRWIEERRMNRLQNRLAGHIIICGYGHAGRTAASEALAQGTAHDQILIIENSTEDIQLASEDGYICMQGNVSHEQVLQAAGVDRASAVMLCLGRDDITVLTTLTIRQLSPAVRIICTAYESENIKLLSQAGANTIIAPSMLSGNLMTNSIQSSHVADYISDLMTTQGRIKLLERMPLPHEVGQSLRDVQQGMAVCLIRDQQRIGFWEGDKSLVQAGDQLLVIQPSLPTGVQA